MGPTPDDRSREVLSPGLVIITAADLPADLVRRSEVGAGDRPRTDRSIDRSIVTIGPRKQGGRGD